MASRRCRRRRRQNRRKKTGQDRPACQGRLMCARLASSGRKHPPVAAAQGSSPDCRFGDGAGSQFIDHTALSSKPAARRCCCRSMGQTDGRTLDRFIIVNPGVPLTLILCFLSSNLYLYFIAIVWIQHVLLPYQTKRFDFEWTLLRTLCIYGTSMCSASSLGCQHDTARICW